MGSFSQIASVVSLAFAVTLFIPKLTEAQIPPNDECSAATVIPSLPFSTAQDTRLATPNPTDPILSCADGGGGRSVWFTYTADSSRFLKFSTLGSTPEDYDVALALFTGTCGALTEVACNDDVIPGIIRQSEIFLQAEGGVTYIIHVAEWNGGGPNGGVPTGGDLVFNVSEEPPPPLAKGPRSGSVPSGVMVSTDAISLSRLSIAPEQRVIPHPLDTRFLKAPRRMIAPKGPEGSNYIEERGVHSPAGTTSRPVVLKDFPGLQDPGNLIPPDPDVAVGPNHVVACGNSQFQIWDKEGNILKEISGSGWFAAILPGAFPFDPQIVYDHFSNRWVMTWLTLTETSGHILLSVSDDDNPIGNWYNWALPSNQVGDSVTTNFDDYPQLGFDDQSLYVTGRNFAISGGGFHYTKIRIVGKAQLYANTGGPVTWTDFWDLRDPDQLTEAPDGVQPAVIFGTPGVQFFLNDSPFRPGTYFTLWKLTYPLTNPSLSAVNIPVVEYNSAPDANQLGGSTTLIEAGESRLRGQPVYRDSSLWAVHSIASGTDNQYSSVRYVRFNPFTNTNIEDVAMGLEGFWYMYPAIMVDEDRNPIITFSRSGMTEYIGAYLTGRKDSDPPGLSPSVPLKVGEANYVKTFGGGRNRWGDYMGVALDPIDGDAVWTHTEYAAAPVNTWGNWVGMVKMGPLPGSLIAVDRSSISFGLTEAGSTSDSAIVTITNNGTDTLIISSITQPPQHFVLDLPALPISVPTFEIVTLGVAFAPQGGGDINDSVVVSSNDLSNPTAQIALSGRGVVIGRAQVGVLYATSDAQSSSKLYSINTSTGAETPIGPLGINEIHGLAIRPTNMELFGTLTTSTSTDLFRVSVGAGDALPFRTLPLGNLRAIAFTPGDTLYGATLTGKLYRIDLITGDTVFVGTADGTVAYSGLAFSPTSGKLWASVRNAIVNRDKIYTVNTSTGAVTLVGGTGDNAITPSISFTPLGTLYGLKGRGTQTNTLISIDTLTAVGTLIGSTGIQGLQAIAIRGDSIVVAVEDRPIAAMPSSYELAQNYPNPFNPVSRIRYGLPQRSRIVLGIYNVLGQEVARLYEGVRSAGFHEVSWDGTNAAGTSVSSGIYFYKLEAEGEGGRQYTNVKKMLLLR